MINLGSDCGDGLNKIHYKLSCASKYKSATIYINKNGLAYADISFESCGDNPSLEYYLTDKESNKSDTITVPNIGLYLIYGMFYNNMLYRGDRASNNDENLGYQVAHTPVTNDKFNPAAITYGYLSPTADNMNSFTNEDLVNYMYNAHLGRNAEEKGYKDWMKFLTDDGYDRITFYKHYCLADSYEPRRLLESWGYDSTCTY